MKGSEEREPTVMLPMLWLPAELILVCICDHSANMCARLVCVSKAVRLHLLQTARDSNDEAARAAGVGGSAQAEKWSPREMAVSGPGDPRETGPTCTRGREKPRETVPHSPISAFSRPDVDCTRGTAVRNLKGLSRNSYLRAQALGQRYKVQL